ncbi:Acetyltransferase (GNAT) family protein [Evansella caseinilytica]|uniref:Acetyltransferase (GNAT) family protein n=1 Tax=Evansella caseinilytica TaxID=1503961 RepID=A0A1H3HR92_9BACI|nr:Acetyltransferase (GNAT) family protein [Evansella caseinilytica]
MSGGTSLLFRRKQLKQREQRMRKWAAVTDTNSIYKVEKFVDVGTDKASIIAFLKANDRSFFPPLSKRVKLEKYAEKLMKEAVLLIVKEPAAARLLAMLGFYCNAPQYNSAVITYLAVAPAARGKGIGKTLLRECIRYVRQFPGMQSIETRTWAGNHAAVKMYTSLGFKIVDRSFDRGEKEHSLELRLKLNGIHDGPHDGPTAFVEDQ